MNFGKPEGIWAFTQKIGIKLGDHFKEGWVSCDNCTGVCNRVHRTSACASFPHWLHRSIMQAAQPPGRALLSRQRKAVTPKFGMTAGAAEIPSGGPSFVHSFSWEVG